MRSAILLGVCLCWLCGCQSTEQAVSTEAGEPVVQVGHSRRLAHVVFSPDRRHLLTSTSRWEGDGAPPGDQLILWDAESGDRIRSYSVPAPRFEPVFCLDGAAIVVDGRVLDLASGEVLAEPADADARLRHQAASHDGRRLAVLTASFVEILDIASGAQLASLAVSDITDDDASFRSCAFQADGSALVSVHQERSKISVWQVANAEKRSEVAVDYVDDVLFSPSGSWIYTRHWPDTGAPRIDIRIYHAQTAEFVVRLDGILGGDSPYFLADDLSCVVGLGSEEASRWDLQTGEKVVTFPGHEQRIHQMELLEDASVLETRSSDRARRWDPVSGELLSEFVSPVDVEQLGYHLQEETGMGKDVVIKPSPDGALFLAGNLVFDAHSDRQLATLFPRLTPHLKRSLGPLGPKRRVFTPDGSGVLVEYHANRGIMAHLRDSRTGKLLRRIAADPVDHDDVLWSPDGHRAVTIGDGEFRLWEVDKARLLRRRRFARASARSIAFSPSGRFLYCHGWSTPLLLWKADTGNPWNHGAAGTNRPGDPGTVDPGEREGRSFVSPDGRVAFSLCEDTPTDKDPRGRQWRLWDLPRGEILPSFVQSRGEVRRPYFSPNSRYMAVPYVRESLADPGSSHVIDMWDLQSKEKLYGIRLPNGDGVGFCSVFFLPDGQRILVNGRDRSLFLVDLHSGKVLRTLTDTHPGNPESPPQHRIKYLQSDVLISPDGRWAVANYGTDYSLVWDLQTGEPAHLIHENNGSIDASTRYQFSSRSDRLLIHSQDRRILDLESGEEQPISLHEARQLDEFPQPLPASEPPQPSRIPEEINRRLANELPKPAREYRLTEDGSRLIAYHGDSSVTLWNVASSEMVSHCHILDRGKGFLTIAPDRTADGNGDYLRYRRPDSLEVTPAP